jgi:Arc/MetJ-type ribon-helix-helix transcriptional regulator
MKTFTAFRLEPTTLKKIDLLIRAGHYRNRTEAVEAGLDRVFSDAVGPVRREYVDGRNRIFRAMSLKEYAGRLTVPKFGPEGRGK